MRFSATLIFAAAAAVMAQETVTATGTAVCEPHGDHWHCPDGVAEPTAPPAASAVESDSEEHSHSHSFSASVSGVCEAHGDHWHCPEGVAEPTTAPAAASATASHDHDDDDDDHDHDHEATAATCEPHGDHWHCPSGVTEPTTAPEAVASGSASLTTTTAAGSASDSPVAEQTENVAPVASFGAGMALLGAAAYLL